MPKQNYRKGNYSKKRKFQRKNRVKRTVQGQGETMVEKIASGAGQVAKLASAVLPAIMAINTEHKYYDQTAAVTAYTPGTNDQILYLSNAIAQGTTDITRIGNSILAKDLQLRMALSFISTLGSPNVVGVS